MSDEAGQGNIEMITAGVDWLTCTMPVGHAYCSRWAHTCISELEYVRWQGYDLVDRSLMGYRGHSVGNCFVGTRDMDVMAQFTGFHADHAFRRIYQEDAHISRIDLQVTVKHRVMPLDVARRGYDQSIEANLRLPVARRRKIYIVCGSDGGDTLYIGSPYSDARCRIYNKEIQSEEILYAKTWRYEVVLRNKHATKAAMVLSSEEGTIEDTTRSIVCNWLTSRGITLPFDAGRSTACLPPIRTLPTDIERQMRWLREQVGPTVRRLTEAGFRDTVTEALGLTGEFRET
jgi:DNA relaxase NicK